METKKAGFPFVRIFLFVLVAGVLGTLAYYSPKLFEDYHREVPAGELRSGGTSAAAFMIDKWKDAYRKETGIKLTYQSTGSSEGIAQVLDRTFAIGFTHSPLTAEQKEKARKTGGEVLHIPVAICAVVPIYNLKEVHGKAPLNFTREVLADIFLGKITRWNDPALTKINEGVKLPDTPIQVVYREDSSGTTFLFTEYLHGVSEEWDKKMGPAASKVVWPVGDGKARTAHLIAQVADTEGAIGYADLLHAYGYKKSLSYGAVQNKDRTAFIHADPDKMAAAANGLAAEIGDDLTFHLTNKAGKDAYPICGAIWAVCYQKQSPDKQKIVADFLTWATHDGQKFAKERNYAPLPEEIGKRVDEKLKLLKAAS
jgi:phosphate ABC transporter phosphate-binding protein